MKRQLRAATIIVAVLAASVPTAAGAQTTSGGPGTDVEAGAVTLLLSSYTTVLNSVFVFKERRHAFTAFAGIAAGAAALAFGRQDDSQFSTANTIMGGWSVLMGVLNLAVGRPPEALLPEEGGREPGVDVVVGTSSAGAVGLAVNIRY